MFLCSWKRVWVLSMAMLAAAVFAWGCGPDDVAPNPYGYGGQNPYQQGQPGYPPPLPGYQQPQAGQPLPPPPPGYVQPGAAVPGQAVAAQPGVAVAQPAVGGAIPGMIYIPPGTFSAGTVPGVLPRCPEREMPGTQVTMNGFYIDEYPAPGAGQQPTVNVDWNQAKAACEAQGKRLCTELEWERACKGTDNSRFPWGHAWNASICGAKEKDGPMPTLGSRQACVTEEGVKDMAGHAWEWTASQWGIPGKNQAHYALRGGWRGWGKIPNRCANRTHRAPEVKSAKLGYRCCSGAANPARVAVSNAKQPLFQKASWGTSWKDLKTHPKQKALFDNFRVVRMSSGLDDPTGVFDRQTYEYDMAKLIGDSVIWRPDTNAEVYVTAATYKSHRKRPGDGTLLIFAEKDLAGRMRLMALYDVPDVNGNRKPRFTLNARKKAGRLDAILAWRDDQGVAKILVSKVTYDCGLVKLRPTQWLPSGPPSRAPAPSLPKEVPDLEEVFSLRSDQPI